MQDTILSFRKKLYHFGKKFSTFFYGGYFPVYLALIITICYTANLALLGLAVCSILASVIFLCYRDTSPIIPILFMVVLCFRDYAVMNKIWGYIILLPAILSFIAKFFLYPIRHLKHGKLTLALLLVTVAFVFSGAGLSGYNFFKGLAPMLTLGPTMLIIYLFFSNTIKPPKGFDIRKYLCYCLV